MLGPAAACVSRKAGAPAALCAGPWEHCLVLQSEWCMQLWNNFSACNRLLESAAGRVVSCWHIQLTVYVIEVTVCCKANLTMHTLKRVEVIAETALCLLHQDATTTSISQSHICGFEQFTHNFKECSTVA